MTTPAPAPADREALAELVNGRPLPPNNTIGGAYEREWALLRADAILARWRLVPVEQEDSGISDDTFHKMRWAQRQGYREGLLDALLLAEVDGAAGVQRLIDAHDSRDPREDIPPPLNAE